SLLNEMFDTRGSADLIDMVGSLNLNDIVDREGIVKVNVNYMDHISAEYRDDTLASPGECESANLHYQ
ncbi:hypothetical protein MKX03_012884, partial [Papaver bracteatum]